MITQDTPIDKKIEFYRNKIYQYLDCVKANMEKNPNTVDCTIWIQWIDDWNREIEFLKELKAKELNQ